ncbi:MAG: hypothetical protein LBR41_03195 [Rickettsiales bacterium]|jgi:hypothetical protein|nr:hypothetical protein [Rickettsiales bacterium]
MLGSITFWTDDAVWAKILTDLGGVVRPANIADINFIPPAAPLTPHELHDYIFDAIDAERGDNKNISDAQKKLIALLRRAGAAGLTTADLSDAFLLSPDANSHVVATMIYTLRKKFGADFIENKDGKYILCQTS